MKTYFHLASKEAKIIIEHKNNLKSNYAISNLTGISKGKIKRCLEKAKYEKKRKPNVQQPWKGVHVYYGYSYKKWKENEFLKQKQRRKKFAYQSETKYKVFLKFMNEVFNQRILNIRVKRSALAYLFLWKQQNVPLKNAPSKSMIYHMLKSQYYKQVKPLMFPNKGVYQRDHMLKREPKTKFNLIEERQSKQILIKEEGHYEADSVIGKKTDQKAIASLLELKTGKVRLSFYQRDAKSFACSTKNNFLRMNMSFKSLTIDNGNENNKLGNEFDKNKIYNCHPYSSWEKGSIENMHKLIRRIIPKSKSLNNYTSKDLQTIENFINSYYRPHYQNV